MQRVSKNKFPPVGSFKEETVLKLRKTMDVLGFVQLSPDQENARRGP